MISSNVCFSDFETYLVKKLGVIVDCKIATWGYRLVNNPFVYEGVGLQSFIDSLKSHKKNITVLMHNGSGFDFHFIIKNIENIFCFGINQFKRFTGEKFKITYLRDNNIEYLNDSEFPNKKKHNWEDVILKHNEVRVLNGKNGILEIKIAGNKKRPKDKKYKKDVIKHKRNTITFRCSKKLFPTLSIKKMGDFVGIKKQDYDYTLIKKYNNLEDVPKKLLEYQKIDILILTTFFKKLFENNDTLKWTDLRLTAASTAYNMWIKLSVYQHAMLLNYKILTKKTKDERITRYYINKKGFRWPTSLLKLGKKLIKELLPTKWLNERYIPEKDVLIGPLMSQYLRNFYSGGLTLVNRAYEGKSVKNITSFDINSSYPSVMIKNLMPYGLPFFGDGGKNYPLKLIELTLKSFINKNGMPFLKVPYKAILNKNIGGKGYPQILKNTGKIYTFHITNDELIRFKKYYICDNYKTKIILSFKATKGSNIFGDYINLFFNKKINEKDPIFKSSHKLFLNSLYGKFGSNNKRENLVWDPKNNKYHVEKILGPQKFYLPMAIFITSYARMKLVDAIGENFQYFVYCDTDSIYIFDNKKHLFNFEEHPQNLGSWKMETYKVNGVFRMPKQYMLFLKNGEPKDILKICIAGIYNRDPSLTIEGFSRKNEINPKTFVSGLFVESQIRGSKTCASGVILEDTIKDLQSLNSKIYAKISFIKY